MVVVLNDIYVSTPTFSLPFHLMFDEYETYEDLNNDFFGRNF